MRELTPVYLLIGILTALYFIVGYLAKQYGLFIFGSAGVALLILIRFFIDSGSGASVSTSKV